MTEEISSFPPGVTEKVKTYVYRLIDPRNGETFYVGKGQGNRVLAHIREQVGEDDPNNKLRRIRDIHLAGFEVAHVIHRHGMDDKTAFEVEAALIDHIRALRTLRVGSETRTTEPCMLRRSFVATLLSPPCFNTRRCSSA